MESTNQENIMTYEMMDEYVIKELGMKPTVHDEEHGNEHPQPSNGSTQHV